jgi:hypothetical protein
MRSVLVLFVIAALGFIFILKKKDAPEATVVKPKPAESRHMKQVSQDNGMKHRSDGVHAIAQNVAQPRKRK